MWGVWKWEKGNKLFRYLVEKKIESKTFGESWQLCSAIVESKTFRLLYNVQCSAAGERLGKKYVAFYILILEQNNNNRTYTVVATLSMLYAICIGWLHDSRFSRLQEHEAYGCLKLFYYSLSFSWGVFFFLVFISPLQWFFLLHGCWKHLPAQHRRKYTLQWCMDVIYDRQLLLFDKQNSSYEATMTMNEQTMAKLHNGPTTKNISASSKLHIREHKARRTYTTLH